jgi:integrase
VLPVLPQLLDIFTKYRSNSPYIFPLLKDGDKEINEIVVNSRITYINKYLKEVSKYAGIFKKISTHCARHTFSDITHYLNEQQVLLLCLIYSKKPHRLKKMLLSRSSVGS